MADDDTDEIKALKSKIKARKQKISKHEAALNAKKIKDEATLKAKISKHQAALKKLKKKLKKSANRGE